MELEKFLKNYDVEVVYNYEDPSNYEGFEVYKLNNKMERESLNPEKTFISHTFSDAFENMEKEFNLNYKKESGYNFQQEELKDIEFFYTNENLVLSDGSKVRKGTQFLIEGYEGDNINVKFCIDERNQYSNDVAESKMQLNTINQCCSPDVQHLLLKENFKEFANKYIINNHDNIDINKLPEIERIFLDDNAIVEDINMDDVNKLYNEIKKNTKVEAYKGDEKVYVQPSPKVQKMYQVSAYDEEWQYESLVDVANMLNETNHKIKETPIVNSLETKGIISKLNIKNEKLYKIDNVMEKVNEVKLKMKPVHGRFDFKHLNDINKALYGNLYNLPKIDNEKTKISKDILKDLKKENLSKVNNINEFISKIGGHISKLYDVGAFKKGNVNTLKEFVRNLGGAAGFDIDMSKVKNNKFEFGLINAKDGKMGNFNEIIKNNTSNFEPSKDIKKGFEKSLEIER